MALALVTLGCEQPTSSTPKAKAVDKTALANKIAEANTLIGDTIAGENAAEVLIGKHFVTESEKATFQAEIAAAQEKHDKAGVTQAEIDTAKSRLEQAIAAFTAARRTGTNDRLNVATLTAKITEAERLLGVTAVSDSPDNVPSGIHYVINTEKETFQSAIDAACTELAKAEAGQIPQDAIDAAVAALDSAITAFTAAKDTHTGTKTTWSYTVSFNLFYEGAGTNPADITVSNPNTTLAMAGISQLPVPAARAGYTFMGWWRSDSFAGAAFTVNDDLSGDVALRAKWLADLDTAALTAKITEAERLLSEAAVSDSPNDVPQGQHYVTADEQAAFQAAITAAKDVLISAGTPGVITEAEVTNAVTQLDNAISIFNAAKNSHTGTKSNWSYTVSFNLNYEGADTNPGPVVINGPDTNLFEAAKPLPSPQRANWVLAGWFRDAAGTGAAFSVHTTVTGDTILYAKWLETPDAAALAAKVAEAETLIGDTAVGETADTVPQGQHYVTAAEKTAFQTAITAARAELTRAGTPGATTQAAVDAAVAALESAKNVFEAAKDSHIGTLTDWSYTVSFNLNYTGAGTPPAGITVGNPHTTLAAAGTAQLPAPAERTGYTFIAWYANAEGTGSPFTVNTALSGDITLYAQWLQDLDTAALAAKIADAEALRDAATVGEDAATVPAGEHYVTAAEKAALQTAITAARAELTRAGTPGATTQAAVDAAVAALESAISVFTAAKDSHTGTAWSYTVSFDLNYPGAGTPPASITVGSPHTTLAAAGQTLPPDPSRPADWVFAGWYDNTAGTGAAFTVNTTLSGDKTLYARWWNLFLGYDLSFNGSLTNAAARGPAEVYSFKRGNTAVNPRPATGGTATYEAGLGGRQSFKVDMVNGFIRLDDNRENTSSSGTANTADPATGFYYNRDFTIAFWVKVNSAGLSGNELVLFSNKSLGTSYSGGSWLTGSSGGNGRNGKGLAFYIDGSGSTRSIKLNSSAGTEAINGENGILIKDNVLDTWVHVAAVYDKNVGTGQVRYYANGVKIGEENIDLSGGLNGNFASYIGSSGATVLEQYTRVSQGDGKNFNNYTMNFNIQDFVLKAGTTTDAQITSMVNAAVGTFTAPNLSFTTGSADGEINYSWTAPAVATVKLYIDEGTKTAAQLKATAPQLITTGALTIPGVFTGTSGASYSALVTASWGTNETESSVVTTVAGVNPNPVLRFETGANDGEISYRWSAGTGKTGHKLWVIIGAPQGATDVEKAVYIKTNGWMIREANTAEETAGVPSTTVKGNPGLIYSAALEALDGGTPIYSMVSNVAAKGTLSATTNIAPLYASLSGQGGVNGTLPFTNGVDGDVDSRYASSSGTFSSSNPKGITLTFGLPVQADSGAFNDWLQSTSAGGRTREFKIQYTDRAGNWQDAYWFNMPNNTNDPVGSTGGDPTKENSVLPIEFYQTVQSTQFRLHLYRAASNDPCFWEWRMYNAGLATTEGTNIAPKATVTASSSHSASYPAASAVDNNAGSRWAITSADWNDDDECWLQLEYTTDQTVNKAAIRSFATRITNFKIQYDNGGVWVDAYEYSGTAIPGYTTTSNTTNPVSAIMWAGTVVKNAYSFTPVTSRKFRLFITGDHTVTSSDPSIWEFYLYSPN